MNVNPVTALVTSSDGVEFAVATDAQAIPFEQAFAAKFTAEQLAQHGDFLRVADARSLTETFTPAPSPQDETPEEKTCDTTHEALCRAQARWHTAAVITGDKS